ncbi:transcriptional regulator [Arcticibacterium luteifluviistationis]|uniref:Transcriptional regulator n=1 Tax=Arcticibacterium luteifluviistationis TaxID=1784714 RepID=A0A2Z4GIA7_9BACT|nr:transcriptional regulator [Arcticibacterium luteifluviistationis]
MTLKPIRTEDEYEVFLEFVDEQFDKKVTKNSPEGDVLEMALLLIKDYEDKHYAIPYPDPIEAIKGKMADEGIKSKDLIGLVGSKSYISAILNRKKPLTLKIARIFHEKLGIPAEVLLG